MQNPKPHPLALFLFNLSELNRKIRGTPNPATTVEAPVETEVQKKARLDLLFKKCGKKRV